VVVIMNVTGRLGTIGKVTGVAASTAPIVRRVATDDDLRADVSDFVASANRLVHGLASDKRLRTDLGRMVAAAQSGGEHLRHDMRPRSRAMFWMGVGMVSGVLVITGALLYPRTRQGAVHAADQTMLRASATVHDLRQTYDRRRARTAAEYPPAGSAEYGDTAAASMAA
jgi:hypothetical protein